MNELAAALAKVQAQLPTVEKTRTAEVYNKERVYLYSYKYADLADVSAAIMPLLGANGLSFSTFPGHEVIDGQRQFGIRYYLTHESGQERTGWWEIQQGTMQTTGGLLTYARRYLLCAVTGVAAEEDVDARGDGQQRKPRQARSGDSPPAAQRTAQRATRTPAAQAPPRADSQPAPPVTMPPLPGEPDEQDYDTPGTVTRPQLTKIAILMGELGFGDDQRDERLSAASRITGRRLSSSKDLSRNEAHRLIDQVEQSGKDWPALDAKHPHIEETQ